MYEDFYIQIYRAREAPRGGWDYLGRVEPEWHVDEEYLSSCSRDDLFVLIPWESVRDEYGGGKYQCRFTVQRPGDRRVLRCRNVDIAGGRKPTWQDGIRRAEEGEERCPRCGWPLGRE